MKSLEEDQEDEEAGLEEVVDWGGLMSGDGIVAGNCLVRYVGGKAGFGRVLVWSRTVLGNGGNAEPSPQPPLE